MTTSSRYKSVRDGGRALARLAPVVQVGIASLGLAYFLDQAQGLLSEAQFTWGERRILGAVALSTLVGVALGGWVVGRLIKTAAELLDVLADGAEAAWRTVDLLETRVVPSLGRIVDRLESPATEATASSSTASSASRIDRLTHELNAARESGDVTTTLNRRDALTEYLRGEALHSLDRNLAVWVARVVERRVREQTADWEVAGWIARALDSLGDMPETTSLRAALPVIRRRAGLCTACGQAVAGGEPVCGRCRGDQPKSITAESDPNRRRSPSRERP